jgi:single-strand DNA-binding protein
MINKVVLVGNLVRDPELTKTQTGISRARFTVAVNRRYGQNEEVAYISCVAWRQSADFITQYGRKGNTVGVEGHITTGSYDDKTTGKKVYTTDVTVDNVQLIGSRNQNESTQAPSPMRTPSYFPDEPVTSSNSEDEFDTGPLLDISSDDLPF